QPITASGHWEAAGAEQPAELVDQRGDVLVFVGIDAEDDLAGVVWHGGHRAPSRSREGVAQPPAETADRTLMVLSQGSLSGHVRSTGWCARSAALRNRQINAKVRDSGQS